MSLPAGAVGLRQKVNAQTANESPYRNHRASDRFPGAGFGRGRLAGLARARRRCDPHVAMAIRTIDLGTGVAAAHEQLARGSPLLVALSTPMDNNEGWL